MFVFSVGDVPEDMKVEMKNRLKKEGATRATSIGDLHDRLNKKMQELRGMSYRSILNKKFGCKLDTNTGNIQIPDKIVNKQGWLNW